MCLFPFQFFIKFIFLVFLGISWYFLVFLGISWYFLVFSHLVLLLNMKKTVK